MQCLVQIFAETSVGVTQLCARKPGKKLFSTSPSKRCADQSTQKGNEVHIIKNKIFTPPLEEFGDSRGIKMRSTTTARSCPVGNRDLMSVVEEPSLKYER